MPGTRIHKKVKDEMGMGWDEDSLPQGQVWGGDHA